MDRAQIHTLEAVVAALLIVGALLFASQATAVTPLSASTSNQHIENQQQTMGEDVLAIAHRSGTLHDALTYWNVSPVPEFRHSPEHRSAYSTLDGIPHPLNQSFHSAFGDGVYAYNIELRYLEPNEEFGHVDMIWMGTPSDNAVTATRTVVLFDDDIVYGPGEPRLDELDGDFWAEENADPDSPVYTVVEVRLTLWRM